METLNLTKSRPPDGSGQAGPDGQAPSTTRAKDFLNKPWKKAPAWPQGEIGHAQDRPGTDVASHRPAKGRPKVLASKVPRLSLVRLSDVQTEKVAWLWYPRLDRSELDDSIGSAQHNRILRVQIVCVRDFSNGHVVGLPFGLHCVVMESVPYEKIWKRSVRRNPR